MLLPYFLGLILTFVGAGFFANYSYKIAYTKKKRWAGMTGFLAFVVSFFVIGGIIWVLLITNFSIQR